MSINRKAIFSHHQMSKMFYIFEHTRKSMIFDESLIFEIFRKIINWRIRIISIRTSNNILKTA